MTENMAQCPLPALLPKGIRVAPGYTANEEFRLTTIGNVRRYGCGQRYVYNGRELTATGQGGFGPDTIDWAHYAALQSAAKPEFKVGQRIQRMLGNSVAESCGTVSYSGVIVEFASGEASILCDDGARRSAPIACIRHKPSPAAFEPDRCPSCGAHESTECRITCPRGKSAAAKQPVEPARVDPYVKTCEVANEHWAAKQDAVAAAKQQQALDQLNRPLRTGPMRDRDKYGQRVALRGWDSDDVD